ncbi:EAL domain-containing protein [Alicycliphilus denitrificans]|uniref:EAL domain-containing protein n=1 Tax=Alicycliphilus denitrificans TaxID=179636 RepID=A0A858ZP58_9BURK|nr:GGDEF and EAL domain-containing protein [Alicycliphilus denitrificans]QKD42626.1 EAL domain-containing protein [Alicycliphilus denitrificans]GAO26191.1 PAS/PAC sensor-containing diguanylate cyclase [Alicycliphilus sp. B1]
MGSNAPGAVPRIAPWWGMALYLLAGAVWVAVGDGLLAHWVQDPHLLARWQTFKGWLYVAFTGVLAWWLLTRMRSAERARSALAQERVQIERHASVGIARVEPAGMRFLSANERLCAWLELPPQAIVQRHFDELVAPDDRASAQRQLQQLLSGQAGHFQGERLCLRAGGGPPLPVLCTVSLVPAAQDEPAHLLCVLQDMGGINAARAALARSENILRLALDGSGSGMWDWDLAQRRITGSQGLLRLLRYRGAELPRGLNLLRRVHPEDRHRLHRAVQRAIAAGGSFDETARLQRFDGSYCWFQARGQCHRDAQGRPERFSGILADLTDRRAAEERQRLASTVLDNAVEGVVVTDAYGCILSINPVVTRVLGYTEQELLGRNPRVFQSGRHDKEFYEAMWESMRRTGHWQGEIWNRRKNGEIFPERMSLSAVRDAQGAVTHYVCMFSDISQEMAQHQRLEFLSHRDSLTGLPNRDWFVEQLRDAMCQALAHGEQMAVLLINLDRFKDVNDSYGHAVGDEVLRHITAQVRMSLRPGDLVGRMAGDEIAVLARNLRHSDGAAAVAQHMIAAASKPWRTPDGIEVVAGVSVGISMFPEHARTAEQLLQGAHSAVYGAKARGRGAHCFFDESMIQAARERLEIEARLRSALAQGHLRLYYQPQVHIATGRIEGAEALLRWLDPEEGVISPARFIPVAETSGVIGPLGRWVMHEACRQGQRWRAAGLPGIRLAVNVSPYQFQLTDVAACAAQALEDSGLPPHCLELELTESALAERPEAMRQVLQRLQALGVRIAVDDFGTGYSSLAHLKRFPIDALKIDQGFIRDIPSSADDMAISATIIAMGRSLGLTVLAEGVETPEQLAFLRARGCDSYQGYLCSRPVPAEQFGALLQAQA